MTRYTILYCLVLTLAGCGPSAVYTESVKIVDPWPYEDAASFNVNVEDSTATYDLLLTLRHSDTFGYQNCYTKITTQYPDGKMVSDVISLNITNGRGRYLGRCRFGSCEVDILLRGGFRFDQMGQHKIIIQQHSREEALTGIKEMALSLYETE